jgi:exonuclease SbcC
MSNPWKVEIKDFQSLRHIVIELVDGVNIITGKTNMGKSAVIRAIDSALFNMGDDSMIRGGKRYYGVSIDNGTHKMVFCRDGQGKNEKTAYQFDDGTVQKKVGRSQLPEVAQLFNIRDVRMQNNTKMKINFWYQNDKPFLMDKTAGQLYEFLSLSSCDKYTKILKKMIVDMKVQEADINNITTEIDTLKSINNKKMDFISRNEGFDDLYIRIITADQNRQAQESLGHIISRIQGITDKIVQSQAKLNEVTAKYNALPIQDIQKSYNDMSSLYQEQFDRAREIKGIASLKAKVDGLTQEHSKVSVEYDKSYQMFEKADSEIKGIIPEDSALTGIAKIISDIQKSQLSQKSLTDRIQVLEVKISPNIGAIKENVQVIETYQSSIALLKNIKSSIDTLYNKILSKNQSLAQVESDLSKANEQLEELKKSAGYCPFCGTVFEN